MSTSDVVTLLGAAAQLAVRDWYLTKAEPRASWERYLQQVERSTGTPRQDVALIRALGDFVGSVEPPGGVRAAHDLLSSMAAGRGSPAASQALLVVVASIPVLSLQASEQDLADLRWALQSTVVAGPAAPWAARAVVALDHPAQARELAEELWAIAERLLADADADSDEDGAPQPDERWASREPSPNVPAHTPRRPAPRAWAPSVGSSGKSRRRRRRLRGLWTGMRRAPRTSDRPVVGDVLPGDEPTDESGTFVNVGLTTTTTPHRPVPADGVRPGGRVWLWVEVGPKASDAIAGPSEPVPPEHLEEGEPIDVVVLPDAELAVAPQGRIGTIRMGDDQRFEVVDSVPAADSPPPTGRPRLYASLQVPAKTGTWRVRIALVVRGTIIHVEQLTVAVGEAPSATDAEVPGVLTTYRLVSDLDSARAFASLAPPTLAIYENQGTTTHDFSFLLPSGADPVVARQIHVDSATVTTYLDQARAELRLASWGSTEAYTPAHQARYSLYNGAFTGDLGMVTDDLIHLALVGRRLWLDLVTVLGERDPAFMQQLQATMRAPGTVQLAIKRNPSHVLPLQILYDVPLDTKRPKDLRLCEPSAAWLAGPAGEPPCIAAGCPSWDDRLTVCISGFWGFRHRVTTSLSNPRSSSADLVVVDAARPPSAVAAVAQDPRVEEFWTPHRERLRQWITLAEPDSRSVLDAVTALKSGPLTIVYFLAHLLDADESPYIRLDAVGGLDGDTLFDEGVSLDGRPLVFLNTCESAGASPERLLGLIDRFLIHGAEAAVGTEITVFVDLATRFGEAFLQKFAAGADLAEAMRSARIAVLAQGNPLGLAYVGYGLHNFHLAFDAVPAA